MYDHATMHYITNAVQQVKLYLHFSKLAGHINTIALPLKYSVEVNKIIQLLCLPKVPRIVVEEINSKYGRQTTAFSRYITSSTDRC
jgi:hypothetical protein